jgi:hypothetical protein
MRKIHCHVCDEVTPSWVVFDNLMICNGCRMTVILYFKSSGLSLAAHPFLDQFMNVESRAAKKNPLDISK